MISDAFKKGPAFIGYMTAGDGGMDYCLDVALALEQGGVDLLEIGLPFSDPVADGLQIQQAMERSLKGGTTPNEVLKFIEKLRNKTTMPLVLMTYYNPVFKAGKDFLIRAKGAGADGILIVDLPLYEMPAPIEELEQIFLVSPTTSESRLKQIAEASRGFIYYAMQKGTTGMRNQLPDDAAAQLQRIKNHTPLPLAAGFGIASKESAAEVLKFADAFIVGSYFVAAMGKKQPPHAFIQLAAQIDPRRRS